MIIFPRHQVSAALVERVRSVAEKLRSTGTPFNAATIASSLGIHPRSAAEALRVCNLQGPVGRPSNRPISAQISGETVDQYFFGRLGPGPRLSRESLVKGCRQVYQLTESGAILKDAESTVPLDLPRRVHFSSAVHPRRRK